MCDNSFYEAVSALKNLPPGVFWEYCFSRYTSSRKIDRETMRILGSRAAACGETYAERLLEREQGTIEELCLADGIQLKEFSMPPECRIEIFALFEPPNTILLRPDILEGYDCQMEHYGLTEILGTVSCKDIILAHEFFHYLENRDRETIFTKTHRERTGFLPRMQEVTALGEIAAMHFAQRLCDLSWSPFILDCVMMSIVDMPSALEIANRLAGIKEGIQRQ